MEYDKPHEGELSIGNKSKLPHSNIDDSQAIHCGIHWKGDETKENLTGIIKYIVNLAFVYLKSIHQPECIWFFLNALSSVLLHR